MFEVASKIVYEAELFLYMRSWVQYTLQSLNRMHLKTKYKLRNTLTLRIIVFKQHIPSNTSVKIKVP